MSFVCLCLCFRHWKVNTGPCVLPYDSFTQFSIHLYGPAVVLQYKAMQCKLSVSLVIWIQGGKVLGFSPDDDGLRKRMFHGYYTIIIGYIINFNFQCKYWFKKKEKWFTFNNKYKKTCRWDSLVCCDKAIAIINNHLLYHGITRQRCTCTALFKYLRNREN